mmetsp:Transcript_7160/g.13081  ORF Transcript_7160/g.13081 Transcript_7160/m.13081 type:complete len:123 (+) Transcript_7160:1608-1976(+)
MVFFHKANVYRPRNTQREARVSSRITKRITPFLLEGVYPKDLFSGGCGSLLALGNFSRCFVYYRISSKPSISSKCNGTALLRSLLARCTTIASPLPHEIDKFRQLKGSLLIDIVSNQWWRRM